MDKKAMGFAQLLALIIGLTLLILLVIFMTTDIWPAIKHAFSLKLIG